MTWVIDGSRRYAAELSLSTTGCGAAVLDSEGLLVAYGRATPPSWVTTAAAAETWALLLTLRSNVDVPQIRTDCYGVTLAARAGPAAATSPKRATARVWREIAELLDNDFSRLRHRVVWIPAHTSARSINDKRKSDGGRFTTAE